MIKCTICEKEKTGKDKSRCLECNKKRRMESYWSNPDHFRKTRMKSYLKHREKIILKNKERSEKLKSASYSKYGGAFCNCCGEKEYMFLSIDHINGGGNEHRRTELGGGQYIHRWLRDNNYPQGFQVLCYNCNLGKAKNKNICPHHQNQKV